MTERLTIARPDDWHLHLRDGAALAVTVPESARVFGRALVMPNLVPPVATLAEARAYRARILEHVPEGAAFEPLMTLYLTAGLTPEEVRRAADDPAVHAVKLYPAGATTNSAAGITDLDDLDATLEALEETGLPLCVHGESIAPDVDVFDRERVFLEETLIPLLTRFDGLRVVVEHITTAEAAAFVAEAHEGIAATITPQHLLLNRNDLFVGGLRPHHYCLPVLKRRRHQEALREAALGGSPRYFLGTDSAPHARGAKESACGCAGCYSAPAALALYAEFFEEAEALERLEGFAAHHGADFYGLPRNEETVTLVREEWTVPGELDYVDGDVIVPLWAGRPLRWRVE